MNKILKINSEEEYDMIIKEIEDLFEKDHRGKLSSEQEKRFNLLCDAITEYDEIHYSIDTNNLNNK